MSATAASAAIVAEDTSGAHAMAVFLATFPPGYTPKTDTRTPADLGLPPV
jgi:hypothetical protein